MFLKKFAYLEHEKEPSYWELNEFELNDINLIVGANSSGKTRTLNVISALSNLLTNPKLPFGNGSYNASFNNSNGDKIIYEVKLVKGIVVLEKLFINGKQLIERDENGSGWIQGIKLKQNIEFKVPNNEIIANRRDDVQHPFLSDLYNWASTLRYFRFAKEHEKNTFSVADSDKLIQEELNIKQTDRAIKFFELGIKKYPTSFLPSLLNDLKKIGYEIQDIQIEVYDNLIINTPIPAKPLGFKVKESDIEGLTDQNSMSDGMFRTLSLLIYFNYYQFEHLSGNVLIDDIGEGLDYDRSTKLIKLLIHKSKEIGIQLIMSTNDRFVMNNTKLEYWQIIERQGGLVSMYNKFNSEDKFKQFKFTGLNNFEFFTTDFFKTGLK